MRRPLRRSSNGTVQSDDGTRLRSKESIFNGSIVDHADVPRVFGNEALAPEQVNRPARREGDDPERGPPRAGCQHRERRQDQYHGTEGGEASSDGSLGPTVPVGICGHSPSITPGSVL